MPITYMSLYDLDNAILTGDRAPHQITNTSYDVPTYKDVIRIQNDRFQKDWNAFNGVPKLRSAIIMKAIWTVGKGYTTDLATKIRLEHITGNGKQTFRDILFSMVVTKQVARDAFALIVRDEDTDDIINLVQLDSKNMVILYNKSGQITGYELMNGVGKAQEYSVDEIFHLTHNQFAGELHGRSVPEGMEQIILTDDKIRQIGNRVAEFQSVPFTMFKVKSDDATTLATIETNITNARKKGKDMIIPDDENVLSFDTVTINPSNFIIEWLRMNDQEFYRAAGMPMVLFGGGGSEANGKTSYLGHETVFENDQLYIEDQVRAQLGFIINLNSPASLLENLQLDEQKDAQNPLTFQPNDVQAGSGRDAE